MSDFPAFMQEINNTLEFLTSLVSGGVNLLVFKFRMHVENLMQISYFKMYK